VNTKTFSSFFICSVCAVFFSCKKQANTTTPNKSTQKADSVTTFAGSGSVGSQNGNSATASFNQPFALVIDASGNLFVGDIPSNIIRKITPSGFVSTFAFYTYTPPPVAFGDITGLTIDASGNLFATESKGSVLKFDQSGSPTLILTQSSPGGEEETSDIVVDQTGNLYLMEYSLYEVEKVATNNNNAISIFAGDGTFGHLDGKPGEFKGPAGAAIDASGNIYVADRLANMIRRISPDGTISTIAGNGQQGFTNGPVAQATFYNPLSVAVDASGNIYVVDAGNSAVRKISNGQVTTLAGTGQQGFQNGPAKTATFNNPAGLAVDASGNVYVADGGNHVIRKITVSH
jgi:sugar lactone lactonase YvrE